MGGFRISELAGRSGFTASALRFYEQAGLLPEAARTPGGYRSYGPEAVDRLRFIARAKQLGLPLEEIRELVTVWDAGSCAVVQDRLAALLAAKIVQVRDRIAELTAFGVQLAAAHEDMAGRSTDGPCDDACGCLADPNVAAYRAQWSVAPEGARLLPVHAAAPATDRARVGSWAELLAECVHRQRAADGVRLSFPADASLAGRLAHQAAAEHARSPFLTFALDLTAEATVLHVRGPVEAHGLIEERFGSPALTTASQRPAGS